MLLLELILLCCLQHSNPCSSVLSVKSVCLYFKLVHNLKAGKPTIFKFLSIIARPENNELKQLFHIDNGHSESGQQLLSLRLGENHIAFAITNLPGTELYQLVYCTAGDQVSGGWNETGLTEFYSAYPMLNGSFYRSKVVYDFPQSTLVSSQYNTEDDAGRLLTAMSGPVGNSHIISELIAAWQLNNIYAVPKAIRDWITQKFPSAAFMHQYSLGLKNLHVTAAGGTLAIDFRKNDFTILAVKGNTFLLAQTFEYSVPADVLYFVLKICQQFSLLQQDVALQLSGLIDQQSSLYNELYQYFKNIGFREPGWNIPGDYPAHFFTSLNDLAQCAS
jgi:Protein of unknown function (DUF3822)